MPNLILHVLVHLMVDVLAHLRLGLLLVRRLLHRMHLLLHCLDLSLVHAVDVHHVRILGGHLPLKSRHASHACHAC